MRQHGNLTVSIIVDILTFAGFAPAKFQLRGFVMKKVIMGIAALCLLLMFFGCASDKPATGSQGGMPDWVLKARRDAPEDVIVGIGSAKLATTNQSMNTSETRARTQIVRAMNSMVSNMIEDYTASSEIDTSAAVAFQQEITVSLARSQLSGARVIEQNSDRDGNWWTVIYYNRSQASRDINQAQAAAKLAVPAALAFNAEARMDEKFKEAAQAEWFGDY